MVYYEYYDNELQQWCLGKVSFHKWVVMKVLNLSLGKNKLLIKRVPKSQIIFEKKERKKNEILP